MSMTLKRLVPVFTAGSLLMCSAVSCGKSGSGTKSENTVIGTWDVDPDLFEEDETGDMEVLFRQAVFTENGFFKSITAIDWSDYIYLYDDKMFIAGYPYEITSSDRNELVVSNYFEEITFTRTSDTSDIFGEYSVPEDFGLTDESTVSFESPGTSVLKLVTAVKYIYNESKSELIFTPENSDSEACKVEFEGNDKMSYTNEEGTLLKFTRAG